MPSSDALEDEICLFSCFVFFFYKCLFIIFNHLLFRRTANKSWSSIEQTCVLFVMTEGKTLVSTHFAFILYLKLNIRIE